ncbi:21924_t:CDS:10 [Entrophospora sp. SA101]|nr:21924_t:CDS:10 [Entrophospora sp. SA101]
MATFATDKDLATSCQQDVHLGVNSFFAVAGIEDRDVAPAPATTEIFGRFQFLKTLLHPSLCEYVEIVKGKHDRLFVIFEYHTNNLEKFYQRNEKEEIIQISSIKIDRLREWAFQILKALAYLNKNKITHHNISPHNILLDDEGNIKLADYGFYYMTNGGADVEFPIGYPQYIPPEAIYHSSEMTYATGKVDVWSLGIILAELFFAKSFWEDTKDIDKLFSSLWDLHSIAYKKDNDSGGVGNGEAWDSFNVFELGINDSILEFLQATDGTDTDIIEFRNFLRCCLQVKVSDRLLPEQLLSHPFFKKIHIYEKGGSKQYKYWWLKPFLQSQQIEFDEKDLFKYIEETPKKDVLHGIPLSQIYYFWKLAGGDVESELEKRGYLLSTPPIERLPRTVKVEDGKEEGTKKDTAFLYSDTIYTLSLKELRQRLENATDPNNYNYSSTPSTNGCHILQSTQNVKTPLLVREKDVGYQFQRVALFSELLKEYPSSRNEIIHHAKVDIPPFLRGKVWAAILGIRGDYQALYDAYDKETERDHQIDVDVPRCHQYHQLLSSPIGHEKLRRLLKCFITANSKLVYWQGMDSLCAPFLTLNFNDEALAFCCLNRFIPKFLKDFFLVDNSHIIKEYLAVFGHLLSFHDPELSSHLRETGYIPDLYAIPWFLTLFTHVLPLEKTYHLWDKLLVGPPSLSLFAGISIVRQLRDDLLKSDFNECLQFAETFPDVDIEKCIQSALSMCKVTPPSEDYPTQRWWEQPIPVDVKKTELAPRISLKDLAKLKNHVLVIDIRSEQDFVGGHFPLSVNFNTSYLDQVTDALFQEKKKYHVVLANRGESGPRFADELVHAKFLRVAVLTGGIDVIRVVTEEHVPVCSCMPLKILVSPGQKGVAYSKCEQNLMESES